MYADDVKELQSWLENTYPGTWAFRDDSDDHRTLGIADDIIIGLFTGIGGVAADTVRDQITEKLKSLVARYRRHDAPDFDVEVTEVDGDEWD